MHEQLDLIFAPLLERGFRDIMKQGVLKDQIETQRSLDVRYRGQSYELHVPYTTNFIADFHAAHLTTYGYAYEDKAIEIVNVRVRAIGSLDKIPLSPVDVGDIISPRQSIEMIQVELDEGCQRIPLYHYDQLSPGSRIQGPALVVSSDTTILIKRTDMINVDPFQNLLIDIGATK